MATSLKADKVSSFSTSSTTGERNHEPKSPRRFPSAPASVEAMPRKAEIDANTKGRF
jgi:hypothetical protein